MPYKSKEQVNAYNKLYYQNVLKPKLESQPKKLITRGLGLLGGGLKNIPLKIKDDNTDEEDFSLDDIADETNDEKNDRLITEFMIYLIKFKNPNNITHWKKATEHPKMEKIYHSNNLDFKRYVNLCLNNGLLPRTPPAEQEEEEI